MTDIKGKKFSLMLDETTDVTVEKLLAICTRYFSEKSGEVVTPFLGLYPVVHATGEALFQIVRGCLFEYGMCLSDCVGIACDRAAVMVGEHNSVWSRMKEESPNCILNKCVCHSLALCVQKAFETLPSSLGYLLTEIPGWFSNSTLRRHAYKELFEDLKEQEVEAESAKKNCHMPFLKLSGTRWLVRGRVIKRFLEHWNELKAYFKLAMQERSQEVRYKARLIHDMLHDDVNYLYFVFLSPVVLEFEKINAFFQSVNIDPDKMFKELDVLHRALKSRIFNRQGHRLSLGMTDFGAQFTSELLRCCKHQESNLSEAAVQGLKQRCQDFLSDLLKEVEKRLPANQAIFQGISGLHPSKVLSQTARLSVLQLPLHHLIEESLDVIEMQYRKIVMHLWSEETVFNGKVPEDSATFWAGIFKYQNGMGQKPYKELALYALACLSCPVSNAVVERVFSQVTCVKTKYRNKMSLKTLDAIVRIRTTLASREVCCVKFTITDDMLRRFQSDIYDAQTAD
ncbi:hypothetical protein HPB47_004919 [Ixodes persulcatus]|uniref:Uncharacterized protein n=1 Tax=Ixodes persulcatus TaxID=34615 RepID=A0AC60R042_IXOPE|nr:hypothetical protein HPB47_004919 [Ixodes persulcatus]